jgi:hypothetical protein
MIEALFDTDKVIDIGVRPVDRGGSADELRIWALVSDKTRHRRIMELKQYAKPATAIYRPQPPIKEWLKAVRDAFWPGLEGSYGLVRIGENSWFWQREKRVSLIDVPYSSKKTKRINFRDQLAIYDANLLAHGRQAQASQLTWLQSRPMPKRSSWEPSGRQLLILPLRSKRSCNRNLDLES